MPAPASCCNQCTDTEIVEVPGVQGLAGADGADGTDGVNAFTLLDGSTITIPGVGGTVAGINVEDSTWMALGQTVFVSDGVDWGHFTVAANAGNVISLTFLDLDGDGANPSVIGDGATVSPAGRGAPLSAALPTAFTDNSTGTPSDTIATLINERFVTMCFPILLTALDTPADVVTDFILPFKGAVISWQMVGEIVATSGGTADADLELQLGAVLVTGSGVTITEADFSAIGEVKAGGVITAANTFAAGATFSIVCTESAVNFTAGRINAYVTFAVREVALINAVASLAEHIDDLITALT